MTKINFEDDVFSDVDDTSLKALADKCKQLEFAEQEVADAQQAVLNKAPLKIYLG